MKEYEIEYLRNTFSDANQFIELTMKNGKETILICKDEECTIINLIIKKDENKKKFVKSHEVIDEFMMLSNKKVVKDNFALSSKYNLDGKIIEINSDESKIQFEKLLVENGNTIEKTNRSFFNKIVGFRTKKVWKMVVASIIYLMLIGAVINMFTDDGESEDKKQDDKKEVATKDDKSNTNDKKETNDKKSDKPKKDKSKANQSKNSTKSDKELEISDSDFLSILDEYEIGFNDIYKNVNSLLLNTTDEKEVTQEVYDEVMSTKSKADNNSNVLRSYKKDGKLPPSDKKQLSYDMEDADNDITLGFKIMKESAEENNLDKLKVGLDMANEGVTDAETLLNKN